MNFMKQIVISFVLAVLFLCSCGSNGSQRPITAEMAYEGVNNYCHSAFDWSIAKDNPSIMYVSMGEETDSAFQVIFRSYTGALTYFYVDKTSGKQKWWSMFLVLISRAKLEPLICSII